MAFSSTITSKMAVYLVTSDKVTLQAFFRCGVNRLNNALVLQVTDEYRMTYDEVVINRAHIKILLSSLINRVHVNSSHMVPQYVDNIAPGIVLTPAVKTLDQGTLLQCLRIIMSAHHTVLTQPPIHFVDIPVIHAMGLVGHLLCKGDFADHVMPLPTEMPTLQFFGIRATGEYTPWDYYLNLQSAILNEGAITILPPSGPVVIQDNSTCSCCKDDSYSGCPCCKDDTPISVTDTDTDTDSHRSPLPESPPSPSPGSPRRPSLPGTSTPGSPRTSSPDTPGASPLSDLCTSLLGSSPVGTLTSHTPRLNALLVSRADREQQGPHHLDEYVRPRPSTPLAVRYMIYRAYRQKIEDFGCSPFNQDHVAEAQKYLTLNQNTILDCINDTLDEAEYRLNRLTKGGLADLIGETGPDSASSLALKFLNDPDIRYKEIVAPELELIALYNHSLRSQL